MDTHPVQVLNSAAIPAPGGHYSHVAIHHGTVYVSGQLPLDEGGVPMVELPFEDQARRVLHNLDCCLTASGSDRSHLVSLIVYVVDMAHWPVFDEVYAAWIGEHRPARAVAGVASLHFGSALEIQAVAAVADTPDPALPGAGRG